MKVSSSLLLLALVTVSPVLAANDEIWGSADLEETKSVTTEANTSSTEQDAIDPIPSSIEAGVNGSGSEEDEAD